MKKLFSRLLFLLLTLCLFSVPSTAQNFEGIIYYDIMNIENQGIKQMTYKVKGQKTRLDFGDGQNKGSMLHLPEESVIVFLIDSQKGYFKMDTNADDSNMGGSSDVEVTKTGETKTIAGKECEVWHTVSDRNTMEACIAKGIGTFMMPKNPMGRNNTPEWAEELMGGRAMPLEVVEIKNGERTPQMRATKIEEKSMSAGLFKIPEGYKDMSEMMRQMQKMKQMNGQ